MQPGSFVMGDSRVRWIPTDERLPMRTIARRAPVLGGVAVFFFGAVSVFIARQVLLGTRTGLSGGIVGIVFIFFVATVSFCLIGLTCVMYKKETEIDLCSVRCSQRGLFGRRRWEERLSNYQGVLKNVHLHTSQVSGSMRRVLRIELWHRNELHKNIVLWHSDDPDEGVAEERIGHFMQLLQLPRVERNEEGIVAKSAEDLEKTLRERDGGEDRPLSAIVPDLGEKVSLERSGEEWRLTLSENHGSWKFLGGMVFSAGTILFIRTQMAVPGAMWTGITVAGVMLLWFSLLFLRSLVGVEELFVTPHEIRYAKRYPWGREGRKAIAARSVTDIHLRRDPQEPGRRAAVTVKDNRETIKFGQSLPERDKVKIKDLIRTLVLRR